jgi:hypothetical protein
MLKYQGFVKKNFDCAIIGGDRIVLRIMRLAEQRIFSKLGKKIYFVNHI